MFGIIDVGTQPRREMMKLNIYDLVLESVDRYWKLQNKLDAETFDLIADDIPIKVGDTITGVRGYLDADILTNEIFFTPFDESQEPYAVSAKDLEQDYQLLD